MTLLKTKRTIKNMPPFNESRLFHPDNRDNHQGETVCRSFSYNLIKHPNKVDGPKFFDNLRNKGNKRRVAPWEYEAYKTKL